VSRSLLAASRVPLRDIAFFQEGPGLRTHQWTADGMKVINVTNLMGDGSVDTTNTDKFIDLNEFETRYAHFAVEENDIVVASSGNTYGKVGRIRSEHLPLMMNTSVIRLHSADKARLDDDFLYAWLRSPEFINQVEGFVTGGAQPNFGPTHLKLMSITLPKIHLQNRIADILSAYDDLIENNRRRMELLEETARQFYREWFVRFRFPGREHTRIINGVPEGWDRTAFENAVVLQRGFDLPIQAREDGDVPVYGSTGINGFHNKVKVQGPGVVTGRSGTLGEVHYVARDFWPLNTALWVKEFKAVTPLFALFLLREMDLKQYNGGVSVPSLDRKAVHRVEILVPPKKLIAIFDEFASPLFAQIENFKAQNDKLRAARDLLLPRLMSGEIAV